MSSPKRFMAIFDAHAGWDKRYERGRLVTRPTFSAPAYKVVVRFAQDFCPDMIVYGGDQLNYGPISHWHKGKPILDEGFRLKDEMELLEETLLDPLQQVVGKTGNLKWLTGNHERWILDHVASNPSLQGMVEPESYLGLWDKGYEIYSQGEIATEGKLNWVHGDIVFKRGTGQNPAATLVNYYNRNIRAGHIHTKGYAIKRSPIDAKDYHSGSIIPGLCTRNFGYNLGMPNNHVHGFEFGWIWPDGSFNDHVAVINDGKFIYNNKMYDGRKK